MSKETLTSTFTELRKGFLRLAMRFLPSQEDADDALQEAFFRLWKQADRISSREEAEALTVVTVKNLCIDILRRRSHLQTVELDENRDNAVGDPESEAQEREERFRIIERIIELHLTPLQRQILHMKEYENKDYEEIAEILGMQPPAVRMQMSRARKEIRACYLKQMKRNERTYQQWKDLADRYFEAETTPEEEKELACFLATPLSQSKDFEELRAVMGFMAMGRATHRKRQVHTFRYAAAAAVTGILLTATVWQLAGTKDVCVAYINGERITDTETVLNEAMKSVGKVRHNPEEANSLEKQLTDIFQTLEEKDTLSVN